MPETQGGWVDVAIERGGGTDIKVVVVLRSTVPHMSSRCRVIHVHVAPSDKRGTTINCRHCSGAPVTLRYTHTAHPMLPHVERSLLHTLWLSLPTHHHLRAYKRPPTGRFLCDLFITNHITMAT